jgi:Sec-independent protein secretion pathway component TatC
LWLFVKPALPPQRQKQSIRYVVETPIWFILGLLFGYYIISPLAVNFLGNYQVSDKISNIIDVSSFMTTVISVSFAAAIAFQLPLLIRLLASIGLVTSDGMRQYRKIAIVALLVFAAVITPPDVVSQCLIFVPCYILYEYGIGIAERIEKRRAKEEAEYQAKMAAEQQAQREQAEKERIAQQQAEAEEQSAESVADTESEELAADGANEPEVRKVTFEVADQESTDDKA